MTISSKNPRTGTLNGVATETTMTALAQVLTHAREAAVLVAEAGPAKRRDWLCAVADALESNEDELVALGDLETALGASRLTGEVRRSAAQLRFYGDVAVEGSYLHATIDSATDATPSQARVHRPLGPVAVFGASNFPFAFGVLGNDTASAIAAGCPVVVKAHPAHPLLSSRLVAVAQDALADAGAPVGILGAVAGLQAGLDLVSSSTVQVVAFTGSQTAGLALWGAANARKEVIPVFAEMGTVNPVIVTAAALYRLSEVAAEFVASFTLGSGQFCTKPGLLLVPTGSGAAIAVAAALREAAPEPVMLTEGIAAAVSTRVESLVASGARVVEISTGPPKGWAAPAVVLETSVDNLCRGSNLLDECFGPVVLIAEYRDVQQLKSVVAELQGALTASVITALGPEAMNDKDATAAVELLSNKVGRISVNDWPTGVACTWAQHHGGPWPATSAPASTSVGAAALDRFMRPITYQSTPEGWLPPPLRSTNPWDVPQRIDGIVYHPAER